MTVVTICISGDIVVSASTPSRRSGCMRADLPCTTSLMKPGYGGRVTKVRGLRRLQHTPKPPSRRCVRRALVLVYRRVDVLRLFSLLGT